ncbi:MAG: hypothetical protein LIP28_00245 [Deltaproteobacteria bacterium]|nr:hypothetical protein [Deltaproteobacteria bacterium]
MTFSNGLFRRVGAFVLCLMLCASVAGTANAGDGTLPPEVQKGVDALLAMRDPSAPAPDSVTLNTFLEYTTSPINLTGIGDKPPFPDTYEKGAGVLWRSRLQGVPLGTTLQYLFNPKVPMTVVYPSSIRYAAWQPGSGILALSSPLWEQFGQHKDKPLVLRGTEVEEITPDDNTGAYYKYTLERVLLMTEHQGRQMLISVSWQKGTSDVGKKAATIGKYSDWDFVYSGVKGTLAKGLGWAETYIYSAASIIVFYEDAPGGKDTGYAMYRWMDAGWKSMNMVKQSHITAGAERSFAGLKAFMESPKRPTPEAIETYMNGLKAQDLAVLQERFAPYGAKVEEAAATTEVLRAEEFQNVIKDGGYGKSMTKEELIAAFAVNYIKQQLGKPLLAGPLD